jgi:spore coat protein CotH
MGEAENLNLKIRENQSFDIVNQKLLELREQSKSLNTQISKITDDKAKSLAKAEFPIEGLAIDDDGVTFEDIPFVQCSSAQRIRVSVAIGLAMNPKLRVLLIREGSLLDSKNLGMIAEMAMKAEAQIWIERVSKGKECSIIIENGEILQPEVSSV